jgi:hypothetical protein
VVSGVRAKTAAILGKALFSLTMTRFTSFSPAVSRKVRQGKPGAYLASSATVIGL